MTDLLILTARALTWAAISLIFVATSSYGAGICVGGIGHFFTRGMQLWSGQ